MISLLICASLILSPLQFWEQELTIPLNLEINGEEIWFDSKSFYNETIRIYSVFSEHPNPVGAVLLMHGLYGKHENVKDIKEMFYYMNFSVLCYDHPGHGKSGGPDPTDDLFIFNGKYEENAHYYISLHAARQALQVLENYSYKIVAGVSYGALNAMWLSGICGDQINKSIIFMGLGDFKTGLEDPYNELKKLCGCNREDYYEYQGRFFDPIYYLNSSKTPDILFHIGTNDGYFYYKSINKTLKSIPHERKYLVVIPNCGHMLFGYPFARGIEPFLNDYALNPDKVMNEPEICYYKDEEWVEGNDTYSDKIFFKRGYASYIYLGKELPEKPKMEFYNSSIPVYKKIDFTLFYLSFWSIGLVFLLVGFVITRYNTSRVIQRLLKAYFLLH